MLCFLALCPQWTYLFVLIGYIADRSEMDILYENNMLQDLLQICKFIGDIIM